MCGAIPLLFQNVFMAWCFVKLPCETLRLTKRTSYTTDHVSTLTTEIGINY